MHPGPSAEVVAECMRAIRAYAPPNRIPLPPVHISEVPHDKERWIYVEDSAAAQGEEGTIYWTFVVTLDPEDRVTRTSHFRSRIGHGGRRDTLPPNDD